MFRTIQHIRGGYHLKTRDGRVDCSPPIQKKEVYMRDPGELVDIRVRIFKTIKSLDGYSYKVIRLSENTRCPIHYLEITNKDIVRDVTHDEIHKSNKNEMVINRYET